MVDVGDKPSTLRWAMARATVSFSASTLGLIRAGDLKKGDVRAVAELAGIMAAKRTPDLIPLCHPLSLSHVAVRLELQDEPPSAVLTSTVRTTGPTGVEMEALMAVSVAALTVYDIIKSVARFHPQVESSLKTAIVSVNREFAFPEEKLHGADEVALFPPVSGGGDPS